MPLRFVDDTPELEHLYSTNSAFDTAAAATTRSAPAADLNLDAPSLNSKTSSSALLDKAISAISVEKRPAATQEAQKLGTSHYIADESARPASSKGPDLNPLTPARLSQRDSFSGLDLDQTPTSITLSSTHGPNNNLAFHPPRAPLTNSTSDTPIWASTPTPDEFGLGVSPFFTWGSNDLTWLVNSREQARLLRHFVKVIAPSIDLTDPERQFQEEVPRRALASPILLNAILAVSARHLSRIRGYDPYAADQYHQECLAHLIPVLNDTAAVLDENLLAATVILRTFEELESKTDSHLLFTPGHH